MEGYSSLFVCDVSLLYEAWPAFRQDNKKQNIGILVITLYFAFMAFYESQLLFVDFCKMDHIVDAVRRSLL